MATRTHTLPSDYQPTPDALTGKIILVTGAGDGIGAVASRHFAGLGATVILLGRTMSKLEAVYDDIEAAGGPQPAIYPVDLEGASDNDYADMAKVLDKEFGHLDGIVHNASVLGDRTAIRDYTPETWRRVMQININAPFALTQALLPLLEAAQSASVIFTSSGVAQRGRAFWGAYAASKAAQDNLMETLADEMEHTQVRFNSLNPGATRTAMRAAAYPAEDPATRPAPEAHMPLYVYLLSDASEGISGRLYNAQ